MKSSSINNKRLETDRDITTQKGNEKGLQGLEVGHYTLFEDAPISYWVEDFSGVKKQLDGLKKQRIKNLRKYLEAHPNILLEMISNIQILDVNRRTLEIYQGDNKGQFLGPLSRFAHENALDVIREEIIALDEGNLPFYAELMNTTLKGKEIWVNVQLSLPPDARETWSPVLISINDITARKQSEVVSSEKEANLSSIFRASPVGIGHVIGREFVSVNERFCELVGYSNEELIGKNARMVYPSDEEYERVGNEKYDQIKDFGIGTVETLLRRKDGEIVQVLLSSTPMNPHDMSQGTTFTALDITDKKRAEKNYEDLVEQSLMGLLVVQDFQIKFVNDAFCQITGYKRDECLSLSQEQVKSMIHEEDQNLVWGRFRDRLAGKETSHRYQYRGIKKNGQIMWLDMSASLVGFGGKPAIQGAVLDITDQVISANQLRISEEKYRDVFDHVSDFLYIHDLEGNLVETNLVWQEKLGYSEQELSNLNLRQIIPTKFHSEFSEYIKKLKKEGHAEGLMTVKSKQGRIRICEYKNSLILKAGKPKMVRGSARDITNQRKVEKELKASEIRFRSLIEQSPISTILYRPDGRPIYGNNASIALWNLDSKLMQYVYDSYNILEDQQLIDQGIMPFIEKGFSGEPVETPPIKYDPSQTNPDYKGTAKWLRASIYPVHDDHGDIRELVVIHEDISDRKQAEEALQKYSVRLEEMVEERTKDLRDAQERLIRQERLAFLGELAGGVGHELRNPLGVITNAIYYLYTGKSDSDTKTQEYLKLIDTEAKNAAKIVSDLLEFGRIKPADKTPSQVSEMIDRVIERNPPPEKVTLNLDIPDELPLVFVDPRQVEQVLTNLVTNAYHAMQEGGKLSIISEQESVSRELSSAEGLMTGNRLRIIVRDTGTGISPENMDKIFEPLFTTKPRGIGLGLAISKMLVEANGGQIEFESQIGKGTVFTLYFEVYEKTL